MLLVPAGATRLERLEFWNIPHSRVHPHVRIGWRILYGPTATLCQIPPRLRVFALRLFLLSRDFLSLLARLGELDVDGLLAAFRLAAFSALAALRLSSLVAVHLPLHFGAGAARIFPFPLGHTRLLDNRCCQNNGVASAGE